MPPVRQLLSQIRLDTNCRPPDLSYILPQDPRKRNHAQRHDPPLTAGLWVLRTLSHAPDSYAWQQYGIIILSGARLRSRC